YLRPGPGDEGTEPTCCYRALLTCDCPGSQLAMQGRRRTPEGPLLRGGLRVLLGAHYLDAHEGLVALDPCVMAWRDGVRLTGRDPFLRAVLKSHGDRPGDRIANV